MRQKPLFSSLFALATLSAASSALADPTLREQVNQRGDFVMFGNTLGFDCADGVGIPAPTLGTVTCPGGQPMAITDTAPDVFWRSDEPAAGQAAANGTITAAQARSTAMLDIPAGATLTYARIYWAGLLATQMSTDPSVRIERPGTALNQLVQADDQFFVNRGGTTRWYQSTADITTLLQQNGEGAYRIGEVGSVELPGLNNNDPMVAWVIVAFYRLATDPPRNLALFDGLDLVGQGQTTTVDIDGFLVPNAGFDAKLGVIAYEGEQQHVGDTLSFNGTVLGNAVNPVNNFFNSSRSQLGAAISLAGDLPRLTGGPGSMAGLDMDVIDVKAQLAAGDTSATVSATSAMNGDTYTLGAFVTSISTFRPDFRTSGKTYTDVNGGALRPGDIIEYSVTVTNTGNDASANTVLTDVLPAGITYVPGSISIGNTTFSDSAGNDVAEYVAAMRTVRVRLGTGANGTVGGTLAIDQSVVVKFRVTIDGTTTGSILNQAIVTAGGALGAPADQYPTDGNGNGVGSPPTETPIDECAVAADCPAATPVCDAGATPNVCVECRADTDCTNPTNPQCLADQTCGCETDCEDTDQDGIPDDTEILIGTKPDDADSDDDGVKDGAEPHPSADSDGDNTIDALDPDSDNDGLFDGTEMGLPCDGVGTLPGSTHCIADGDAGATTTDPVDPDTDDGGVRDGSEDIDHDGVKDAGETDPNVTADDDLLADPDGDGLTNGEEDALGSDPDDADSDDDGVIDGDEANPADDTDGDGVRNVSDPDSDNDGLPDGTELGLDCGELATDLAAGHCTPDGDLGATVTSPIDPDTDGGGVTDGNEDIDLDGVKDAGETDPTAGHGADDGTLDDSDGDGLSDGLEGSIGSDPDDADSDDDGVKDGSEANPADDTDGDHVRNVNDPDSDNDGIPDGTELGLGCGEPATDVAAGHCTPDGDQGTTVTSPIDPDTDGGGVTDGNEDIDRDGVQDAGETDPTAGHGADDGTLEDSDGDGLSDGLEGSIGSDPDDADSDDDGVKDGSEANPADDTDGDGVRNVNDPDSDNDGIPDGTELGLDCDEPATDFAAGHCTPDGDEGATVTSPIDPDTDAGGVTDGNEDIDRNGVQDAGETDPTAGHGADDGTLDDTDGDGLSDGLEGSIGSDPDDADSDDDGVKDGSEPNFADDTDGDGLVNALDPDSDGDGLFDGTELGLGCADAAIDAAAGHCIADADGGATTTNPLEADTDGGSVKDGDEDTDHDGAIDAGERDPNDPSDDGQVPGGEGGAGGAGGEATTGGAGGSTVAGSGGLSGTAGSATAGSDSTEDDGVLEGGGCACRTSAPASSQAPLASLISVLGALGAALVRRRRGRR